MVLLKLAVSLAQQSPQLDASRDIGNITEGDVLKLTCIYSMCKEMARRDIVSRLYLQEMAGVV